jgi:hypothetical protein
MNLRTSIVTAASALVLATAGSAAWAAQFAVAPSLGGGASLDCSIPNNVVCTVSSNKGVKSVRVTANGPYGAFNLVDKAYRACPKQVTISWDSAYHSTGHQIVECSSMKLTN